MKNILTIGLLLIIVGVVLLVYKIITGDGNFNITKSVGFIVFFVGLFTIAVGQFLIQKNKKNR